MPPVSVGITCYNHEKYVGETIRSILDQTFRDIEIIIIDNNSTDRSPYVIRSFTDPRIRLIRFEKNEGHAAALNKFLEKASGDYLSVVSSDDLYMPNKIEAQVNFLERRPDVGAVFSFARIIDDDGNDFSSHRFYPLFRVPNRTRHEWLNHFFYRANCLCAPSALIRRECQEAVGPYDERLQQIDDLDMWVRLCMRYEIHVIPEELVSFRVRRGEANVSGRRPETTMRFAWEYLHVLKHYLAISTPEELARIFPPVANQRPDAEPYDIRFLVSRLALEAGTPLHSFFAMETLFRLLGDRAEAARMERKYGFTYRDLINLTGKHGAFDLPCGWMSRMYVDTGDGYSETQSLRQPLNPLEREFALKFDLARFGRIRSLRWDPVEERFCRVRIASASYRDEEGCEHELDPGKIGSNGYPMADGSVRFETFDPKFFIPAEGRIISISLAGELELVPPAQVEKDYISVPCGTLQIFWPVNGAYAEERSYKVRLRLDGELRCHEILLPPEAREPLRIDPVNMPAYVEIHSLEMSAADAPAGGSRVHARCSADNGFKGLSAGRGIVRIDGDDAFAFIATDGDPQLFLAGLLPPGGGHRMTMRITMRAQRIVSPRLRQALTYNAV